MGTGTLAHFKTSHLSGRQIINSLLYSKKSTAEYTSYIWLMNNYSQSFSIVILFLAYTDRVSQGTCPLGSLRSNPKTSKDEKDA